MRIFENLPENDLQLLLDTPILITILIGSADGHLDEDEIKGGLNAIRIKEKSGERILRPYFEKVANNFDSRNKFFLKSLPKDAKERNAEISKMLSKLNDIYTHLDQTFVEELNKNLRSLAHEVAISSGGILGFGAESYEEKQWVDLSMIKK